MERSKKADLTIIRSSIHRIAPIPLQTCEASVTGFLKKNLGVVGGIGAAIAVIQVKYKQFVEPCHVCVLVQIMLLSMTLNTYIVQSFTLRF